MYIPMVITLLLVAPLLSIAVEVLLLSPTGWGWPVLARWLVFWAVGMRLGLAGMRQITKPAYTAQTILGLQSPETHIVVRELGFANCAMACVGLASLWWPAWVMPACVLGTVYYALAGIQHTRHSPRNTNQNVAMVSDLLVAAALAACCMSGLRP